MGAYQDHVAEQRTAVAAFHASADDALARIDLHADLVAARAIYAAKGSDASAYFPIDAIAEVAGADHGRANAISRDVIALWPPFESFGTPDKATMLSWLDRRIAETAPSAVPEAA